MPRQSFAHVSIDLQEGLAAVAIPEVVSPTAQMPVEVPNQLGQGLEATPGVDHPPQLLALARQSLGRGLHVPVAQFPSVAIPFQPQTVTEELQRGARLA